MLFLDVIIFSKRFLKYCKLLHYVLNHNGSQSFTKCRQIKFMFIEIDSKNYEFDEKAKMSRETMCFFFLREKSCRFTEVRTVQKRANLADFDKSCQVRIYLQNPLRYTRERASPPQYA